MAKAGREAEGWCAEMGYGPIRYASTTQSSNMVRMEGPADILYVSLCPSLIMGVLSQWQGVASEPCQWRDVLSCRPVVSGSGVVFLSQLNINGRLLMSQGISQQWNIGVCILITSGGVLTTGNHGVLVALFTSGYKTEGLVLTERRDF